MIRGADGRRCRTERGQGVVLALPLVGVLVTVTVMLAVLGSVVVAQRRAQSAADLAALAGGAADQRGHDACAAAAGLARRNGAVLEACRVLDGAVSVRAVLEVSGLLGRSVTVRAEARAGPTRLLR